MDEPSPPASRPVPVPGRHDQAPHTGSPGGAASVFVYGLLLAAVTAAIFLAAGPAQGSLGIFLAAAGVALTFLPARVRVEWTLWLAVGGLLAAGSVAFFPSRWFAIPPWREKLAALPAIHLPTTVTPIPWETGFWLAALGASCLTGLFLLGHPIRSRAVFGVAAAAVLVCGAYAALSIYAKQTGWHYPYAGGATFGFFPNRNHTADFLVTGSVLALGVLTTGLRERRWLLTALVAAGMAACVTGLFFYSGSRGGVVFLVVGTLIWIAGLGGTHRNLPLVVSVVALAVAAGLLFFLSGGEARARLFGASGAPTPAKPAEAPAAVGRVSAGQRTGDDHDTPLDFRVLIYRDTAALLRDAPVTGTGLGAFAPVFAQYRRASLSGSVAIHPESDWLMLAAEAGVPALVFALVAGGLLLLRLRGAREHPFWPLRWGCVAAAATALLHGVVDVPAHRVTLGWWILLLAALGFQSGRSRMEKSPLVQRALFVLGGLGVLGLGVQLVRAEWFGAPPLPPFAAGKAQEEITALIDRQDADAALERAQSAISESPMSAPLYYQLGALLLHYEGTESDADQAFAAQRALNPNWPAVPLLQGDVWMAVDPKRTVVLWLEALDRQTQIERVSAPNTEVSDGYYRSLLSRSGSQPEVQRGLAVAAMRGPKFLLTWLEVTPAAMVREQLSALVKELALLARFSTPQREKFLLAWDTKGDREALSRFLNEHPDWQPEAWGVKLRQLLRDHQFEAAVREAATRYHVSLALPATTGPEAPLETVEARSDDPVKVFAACWQQGNTVSARRILEEATRANTAEPIDPEVWRLKAALAAQDGAWSDAWGHLGNYLRCTGQDQGLP